MNLTLRSALVVCIASACGGAPESKPVPSTPAQVQSPEDPYLWLEEVEGKRALEWVEAQNARTLADLQGDPRYATLEADALRILEASDRIAYPDLTGFGFANFWQDPEHVRGIWRTTSEASYRTETPVWETLFDLDALAKAEGKNWVWKGAGCLPPDDTRCLVNLSDGGKDAVEVREFDTRARAFVEGGFRLPESKQDAAWLDLDTLIVGRDWGTGTLTESGYPFVLKAVRRGAPLEAATELYRGVQKDMGVWPAVLRGPGRTQLLFVRRTSFYEVEWLLARSTTEAVPPLKLPVPSKSALIGLLGPRLLFTIDEPWTPAGAQTTHAAGTLLALNLDAFLAAPATTPTIEHVFTPEARQAVQQVAVTAGRIVVSLTDNVRGRLLTFTPNAKSGGFDRGQIPVEENAAVSVVALREADPRLLFNVEGYLTPPSLHRAHDAEPATVELKRSPARFDAQGLSVEQTEAVSKDGTRIPYFVVRKAGAAPPGETPTLLYAYGGFQVPLTPWYVAVTGKLWLERGGAFAVANIRGGSEFGPAWHQAGLKTQRQRIYDDFEAVARALIQTGVTRPGRLGIQGGSNGGLLMGVQLTQHPELYRAVSVQVPLLDMLRYHTLLAGASWMAEYGDPADPVEGAFLRGISPYHNVRPEVTYPEPFFVTSTRDDRVHPGHARKMAARLAELGKPFLYWENTDGGHSAAADLRAQAKRHALTYVYLLRKLVDAPGP
jgi:prolyl oligopeptidase